MSANRQNNLNLKSANFDKDKRTVTWVYGFTPQGLFRNIGILLETDKETNILSVVSDKGDLSFRSKGGNISIYSGNFGNRYDSHEITITAKVTEASIQVE